MARGHFAVRVKEELAALRPGAPSERRALLAGLLRFAATLHLAGTVGPRVTLVLATESGGVARLAFWLLHAAYGVRPEFRMRTRGALVARVRYEVVLAERVERVLGGAGILDGSGQLATGVPARLVRGRAAAACYARGAFLGRGSVTAPTRAPHLEIGMPDEHSARDLAALLARLDLPAAAGVRAGAHEETWRVVVKGGEAIGRTLATLGARDAYLSWEDGHAARLGAPARGPGRGRHPAPRPPRRHPRRARRRARPAPLQGRGARPPAPSRGPGRHRRGRAGGPPAGGGPATATRGGFELTRAG